MNVIIAQISATFQLCHVNGSVMQTFFIEFRTFQKLGKERQFRNQQNRCFRMGFSESINKVGKRCFQAVTMRIGIVIKHKHRGIFNLSNQLRHLRFALSAAGKCKVDERSVQHPAHLVCMAYSRTACAAALLD